MKSLNLLSRCCRSRWFSDPAGNARVRSTAWLLWMMVSLAALPSVARAADPEVITPTGAAVLVGDTLGGFEVVNLINGVGLSEPVTLDNYTTVTHSSDGRWVTSTARFPNYFSGGFAPPVLEFTLDGSYAITSMVVWGYAGNNNEGTDFHVEFSSDGGVTYDRSVDVASEQLLATVSGFFDFAASYSANKVKITITNNGGGRGFTGVGTGDRVGLGEIRFIGTAEGGPVSPPAIQQPPASITVLEGASATFTVVASGRAPLTYQWQKDQKDLPNKTGDTLTLDGVTLADAGSYRVLVTNEGGTTPSAAAQLTVIRPDPGVDLITPSSISILAGDSLGGFAVENLINDSGFAQPPTAADYAVAQQTGGGLWVTSTAVFPDNYFDKGKVPPQFLLGLPGPAILSDLIVWGYGGNNNEASDFVLEFSVDGGNSFGAPVCVATTNLLGNSSARLSLGSLHPADTVRITMVDNAGGRGFTGVGPGDRVGLGEIKFLAANPILVAPTNAVLVAGDTLDGFELVNLINGNGLSAIPTIDTYTQVTQGDSGKWVTATGTFPLGYFASGKPAPVIDLDLGGRFSLQYFVIWGYGGNNNEATDFSLQFSDDGGSTFGPAVAVASPKLLGNGVISLELDTEHVANWVRVTITNNGGGRGFSGVGPGDRVGLGEIRLIGRQLPAILLPSLSIATVEAGLEIQFCNGLLESATALEGPWALVDAATSPYIVTPDDDRRFFRVR